LPTPQNQEQDEDLPDLVIPDAPDLDAEEVLIIEETTDMPTRTPSVIFVDSTEINPSAETLIGSSLPSPPSNQSPSFQIDEPIPLPEPSRTVPQNVNSGYFPDTLQKSTDPIKVAITYYLKHKKGTPKAKRTS
jgi:hypothetical protein